MQQNPISGLDEFGYEVYVVLRVHKSKERVNVAPTWDLLKSL